MRVLRPTRANDGNVRRGGSIAALLALGLLTGCKPVGTRTIIGPVLMRPRRTRRLERPLLLSRRPTRPGGGWQPG
jgi:hypothetical protein